MVPSAVSKPFVEDPDNEVPLMTADLQRRRAVVDATVIINENTPGLRGTQGRPGTPADDYVFTGYDGWAPSSVPPSPSGAPSGSTVPVSVPPPPDDDAPSLVELDDAVARIRMCRELAKEGDMESFTGLSTRLAASELDEVMFNVGHDIGHVAGEHGAKVISAKRISAVKRRKGGKADMNWKAMLADPTMHDGAVQVYNAEIDGLKRTIFVELGEGTAEFALALKGGTRSRVLLSQKRSNVLKARAVKRGDLENVLQTGGYHFCYNASVASLKTIRLILSLPRGGDGDDELVLAVIDVSYAFLQSNRFEDGKVKYTFWKDVLTGKMRAFRASGPQYGERSAPTRWLDTLIEFMASIGFESCYNEPSVFIDRKTGVIVAVSSTTLPCTARRSTSSHFW